MTSPLQHVRIKVRHPAAQRICIAGSFNDRHPDVTEMISLGRGKWAKELTLPSGRYEYRLVVDGQWMPDPAATETAPNPHGGVNSVLRVNQPADDARYEVNHAKAMVK